MATSVPFAYASKDTVIFPDSVPEGGLTAALDIQIRSACFDAFLRRYVDYCKAHDSISTEANEANQQACMDTCTKILEAAIKNGDFSSAEFEATLEGLSAYYGGNSEKPVDAFTNDVVTLVADKAKSKDADAFKEVITARNAYFSALENLKAKYMPLFKENVDAIENRYGALLPADFFKQL